MGTSPNSTEANWNGLTFSPEDSPAKTSPKLESVSESRDLAAAFGLNSPVLLGNLDPDSFLLRMSQGSLFQEQCPEWSESWPDSGMWDAGAVYELQSLVPVISESASSSWPTPSVPNGGRNSHNQISGQWRDAMDRAMEHPNWATPHANCTTGPGVQGRDGGENIQTQAEHWNTPHGMSNKDFRGKTGGCGGGEFAKQANIWQTPATDSFRSRGGDRKDEMGLDQQARSHQVPPIPDGPTSSETFPDLPLLWRSPTHCSENSLRGAGQDATIRMEQGHTVNLQDQVATICKTKGTKRRLNPQFVEWLMGFPIGWSKLCKIERSDSANSETA